MPPAPSGSSQYDEGEYGAAYALFRQRKYRMPKWDSASMWMPPAEKRAVTARTPSSDRETASTSTRTTTGPSKRTTAHSEANTTQQQYAGFQQARCLGLDGELDASVAGMTNLLQDAFPETTFKGDALTAIGKAEIERDRMAAAKAGLRPHQGRTPRQRLCQERPRRPRPHRHQAGPRGRRPLPLANHFHHLPGRRCDEGRLPLGGALAGDRGQLDALPDIVGLSDDDIAEKTYAAAQDLALSGQCAAAMPKLQAFLDKHPESVRVRSARFHLGQCQFESGQQFDEALLATLETVVEAPLSDYHESALVLAATLRYNREEWREALAHYQRLETVATLKRHVLEARIGIMRCSRELGRCRHGPGLRGPHPR